MSVSMWIFDQLDEARSAIAAKDREIAALQAALELGHEETKRLREIIAGLRGLSASLAPDPAKSVGSVTHIPSSPLIVDDAPDPAEAMRAKTITVQGMFGPRSSHTLECPYPNTAKNCTCGGIDAALKGNGEGR